MPGDARTEREFLDLMWLLEYEVGFVRIAEVGETKEHEALVDWLVCESFDLWMAERVAPRLGVLGTPVSKAVHAVVGERLPASCPVCLSRAQRAFLRGLARVHLFATMRAEVLKGLFRVAGAAGSLALLAKALLCLAQGNALDAVIQALLFPIPHFMASLALPDLGHGAELAWDDLATAAAEVIAVRNDEDLGRELAPIIEQFMEGGG